MDTCPAQAEQRRQSDIGQVEFPGDELDVQIRTPIYTLILTTIYPNINPKP